LARQLKELRGAAGFGSMEAAAAATGLSRATISRIESAKQVILPRTVRVLCQVYRAEAALDTLLDLAEEAAAERMSSAGAPSWFQRYLAEESDATGISTYQSELVPDLLRTDDYDRAVLAARGDDDPGRPDRLARRQERLAGKHPPRLHVVLNEAVLLRQVGGPATIAAQLAHLLDAADRPNVTVQVLPFSAGAHPAMTGSFTMLVFPRGTDIATVYAEVDSHGVYRDRPADVERHTWIFQRLRRAALDPAASRALIADRLNRPG
jgi:transcriptional regulator with XRE-family HTH domain